MKKILLTAAALSMLAAPAFAQLSPAPTGGQSKIQVSGTVAARCGAGNQSGGGGTGPENVALGALTDTNGFLSVAPVVLSFGNMWCNSGANLTMVVSELQTPTVNPDSSSFTNKLDMIVSGAVINTYFNDVADGSVARTGAPLTSLSGGAFETGTGQYSKATLNVALPAGTVGNDRPLAGNYKGTVTFTASVS